MILLDEEGQQTKLDAFVAGPTLRLPDRASIASARTVTPLPDYETSQAQHIISPIKSSTRRIDSKFWRATLYALAIYVGLSVVIGVPLIVTRLRGRKFHGPPQSWDDQGLSTSVNMASTGIIFMSDAITCDVWDSVDDIRSQSFFSASTSHSLSPTGSFLVQSNVSSDATEARGISGNLTVDLNPDPSISAATFLISLESSSVELREKTHVCFTKKGNGRGLSIYVPNNLTTTDFLTFNIHLLFPQQTPLNLSNLVTTLPMFSQWFGELGNSVVFQKIALEGASMDISCGSLQAGKISVKSSLSSITGTFNVSETLSLDTVGGAISANITLVHAITRDQPTFFSLDTGNSEIAAQVTLLAPSTRSYGPPLGFIGVVKTFNAPLSLNISHDPSTAPVPLDLRVQNNQAESNVYVDSKYSGMFDVQTKLASATLDEGKEDLSADPSGANTARQFLYDQSTSTRTRGWAGWGKRPIHWDPGRHGRVEVISSLSPVKLQLGS